MELTNRLSLEADFAAKFARLYGSHRRKVAAALKSLGDNPDPKKIPASLWSLIESETEQQLAEELLLLYLLILAQSSDSLSLGLREPTQQAMATAYAGSRSKEIAAAMTDNSRQRIESGSDPLEVFSPERAATVARTEISFAQSAGTIDGVRGKLGEDDRQAAFEEAEVKREKKEKAAKGDDGDGEEEPQKGKKKQPGESDSEPESGDSGRGKKKKRARPLLVAYWRHSHIRPKGHAGAAVKPCPTCTPRLDKPESQWGGLIPGQAHPHCDCYVDFVGKEDYETAASAN